ncbi:MAG: hypothetical protein AAGJ31_04890, partial [Verrucomicrobiota bacterium]
MDSSADRTPAPTPQTIELDTVILGGGFTGVYCGKQLCKMNEYAARRRMAIISKENYMVFQPMLAEVAGASLSPSHVVNPIRMLCKGMRVLKGEVT